MIVLKSAGVVKGMRDLGIPDPIEQVAFDCWSMDDRSLQHLLSEKLITELAV